MRSLFFQLQRVMYRYYRLLNQIRFTGKEELCPYYMSVKVYWRLVAVILKVQTKIFWRKFESLELQEKEGKQALLQFEWLDFENIFSIWIIDPLNKQTI